MCLKGKTVYTFAQNSNRLTNQEVMDQISLVKIRRPCESALTYHNLSEKMRLFEQVRETYLSSNAISLERQQVCKQTKSEDYRGLTLRNDYFKKHYSSINSIACAAARLVRKKFTSLEQDDLLAYALEGIIVALSKWDDFEQSVNKKYLYIHAYKACFHGALQMSGIHRRRKRYNTLSDGQEMQVFKSVEPINPEQMIAIQDNVYLDSCGHDEHENNIVTWLDSKIFYHKLKSKQLRQIFLLILKGRSSQYICKKLKISSRAYYYQIKKLYAYGRKFKLEQESNEIIKGNNANEKIDLNRVISKIDWMGRKKFVFSAVKYKVKKRNARIGAIVRPCQYNFMKSRTLLKK